MLLERRPTGRRSFCDCDVERSLASNTTVTIPNVANNRPTHVGRAASVLDASRSLAALAVVIEHARTAILVDPRSVAAPTGASMMVYWVSGFGHQAVVIFFVLSGALVGGSLIASISSGKWTWRSYLVRRLSRLYIVLFPALLLIALWDGAGMALFPVHSTYQDVLSAITIGSHTLIVHNRDVVAFLGNMAFIMTVYVPVFGSGAALWSLSNEFWYYMLFPCIVIAVVHRRDSWRSLCNIVLALGILVFVNRDIIEWMIIWLLGVAVVRLPRVRMSKVRATQLVGASLLIFGVTTAFERTLLNTVSLGGDVAVGFSFALFLYCVFCRESPAPVGADMRRSAVTWRRLAGFSYTLYLFHQPPLAFVSAWLVSTQHVRWQPTAPHVAVMLAVVGIIVAYSYVGSRVTEAHTDLLRRFLTRLFIKPSGIPMNSGMKQPPIVGDAMLS